MLVMVAVWLGAYSAQYYTWTAPTQVSRLTYNIVVSGFSAPVNTTGSAIFGNHPTATTPAVPAQGTTGENATIIIGENYIVHFTVTDAEAAQLASHFQELTINIRVYRRGLVNAPAVADNNLYVVSGGVAQTNIDNWTPELNAAYEWDPVITVNYTTKATAATEGIAIGIYVKEP